MTDNVGALFDAGRADAHLEADEEAACWAFIRALFAPPRVIDAELERATGLRLTEYGVLIAVAGSALRAVRPADLAAWVQLTPSGLTRLVNRLIKLGLTARVPSPSDRRSHMIVLTAADRRMVESSHAAYQACLRRVVLDNLHGLDLTRLTAAFAAMGVPDSDRPAARPSTAGGRPGADSHVSRDPL